MLNSWVYRLLKKMYLCMADRVYHNRLVTGWSSWSRLMSKVDHFGSGVFFHSLVTIVTSFHRMISDH